MQYIKGLDAFDGRNQTAVTLGKFDGLHRGHQKLLNRIMKYAQKEDCDSVVCAFDMDRDCLMTNEERRAFLEDKVDYLIEIPFTREMMEMEAEKFIEEILYKKLHASHIVVGTDFNFGHEKRGNHQMLEKYAAKYGYTVDVVEKAYYKDREISSTYIRELLLDGNVPLANELLGYPYHQRCGTWTAAWKNTWISDNESCTAGKENPAKVRCLCLSRSCGWCMVWRCGKCRGETDRCAREKTVV